MASHKKNTYSAEHHLKPMAIAISLGTPARLHVQQQLLCAQGTPAPSSQQATGAADKAKAGSPKQRLKLGRARLGADENEPPLAATGGCIKPAQASRRARQTRSMGELLAEPTVSLQAQQQAFAALDALLEEPQVWLCVQYGQHRAFCMSSGGCRTTHMPMPGSCVGAVQHMQQESTAKICLYRSAG